MLQTEVLNNSYALLIGIKDPLLPSVRDATDIRDVLINNAGYLPENVFLLTNEKATKKGVLDEFDKLISKTNADSKVLLYYSGHGKAYTDGTFYLEVEGFDKSNPDPTGVIARELKEKLNKIIAERLVFFIDSCFAQGMTKGSDLINTSEKLETLEKELKEQRDEHPEAPEGLVHDLDDEEGMAIISACKDNQKSLYFKGDDNSLFTTYLLKVLKGEHKTSFDSEFIKLFDVVSYLVEEVPKDAALANRKQNPFANLQTDKNFELSRVPKSKLLKNILKDSNSIQQEVLEKKEVKKVFRKTENANNVILFVHGFSGDAHNTFGNIPELFTKENRLDGWDMFPYGLNANVNPEIGKDVWASVRDINRVADNLSSAIKHKFKAYDRIAIVAHGLGGIVAQRAILNLDFGNKDKISHVLLFGTPSNGITNDAIKNLWENKINELIKGQPFIENLRSDWNNTFNNNYPFDFKVVYARRDDYVSKESCLNPFDKSHWETVLGDHFSMAKVENTENDSYNLILETLTDNKFTNKFLDKEEVNLILGEYDEVVRLLMPNLEHLDEQGLERLIYALESLGQRDKAFEILNSHRLAKTDPDIMSVLGGLYKRKYLDDSHSEDGKAAFDCYTKALKLATDINQSEQICANARNLAFLNLILGKDYEQHVKPFAVIAIETALKFSFDKIWKLRALAEGYIYLNNLEKSKDNFIKLSKKADVREKLNTYSNSYTAYTKLNDTENNEDDFMKFLRLHLLT